jgi:hypothetical protein
MLDARRHRLSHRHMLAIAFGLLLLLVVLVGVVLVREPASLPASNAAADCGPAASATARGYGESGAGGVTSSGYGESGAGGVTGGGACEPDCDPKPAGGATGRGYGESGAGGVTAPGACDAERAPCPDRAGGATGRGYGESGAGGVTDDASCVAPASASEPPTMKTADAASDGGAARAVSAGPPPTTGGGGATVGRVPGATGRDAPKVTDAASRPQPVGLHREPLGAAVVAQASAGEGGRRNTAIVVGGLALLVAGVAVVLRRGRSGPSW